LTPPRWRGQWRRWERKLLFCLTETGGESVLSEGEQLPRDAAGPGATLAQLATYIEEKQPACTEQWLLAVQRDAQIATADRLTHRQLLDNLPNLYREYCAFLRTRDAFTLSHEVR